MDVHDQKRLGNPRVNEVVRPSIHCTIDSMTLTNSFMMTHIFFKYEFHSWFGFTNIFNVAYINHRQMCQNSFLIGCVTPLKTRMERIIFCWKLKGGNFIVSLLLNF
eukprot:GHVR01079691.1.p1 GENE.GHVR01079691.1~~GHVR01079691.1.p1  ORF type:complete len:106 (+),score=6.27 GHVR01079691.1:193-510(+)